MTTTRYHALEVTLQTDMTEHRARQVAALVRLVPGVSQVAFRPKEIQDHHARLRVRDRLGARLVEALNELIFTKGPAEGDDAAFHVVVAVPSEDRAREVAWLAKGLHGVAEAEVEGGSGEAHRKLRALVGRELLIVIDEVLNGPNGSRTQPHGDPSPSDPPVPKPPHILSPKKRAQQQAVATAEADKKRRAEQSRRRGRNDGDEEQGSIGRTRPPRDR